MRLPCARRQQWNYCCLPGVPGQAPERALYDLHYALSTSFNLIVDETVDPKTMLSQSTHVYLYIYVYTYTHICSLIFISYRLNILKFFKKNSLNLLLSPDMMIYLLLLFTCSVMSGLGDPMDCSMPGFPVLHYLPELTQTHVRWVDDAIQPSHRLSYPSPHTLNLSQHQGLFPWVVVK